MKERNGEIQRSVASSRFSVGVSNGITGDVFPPSQNVVRCAKRDARAYILAAWCVFSFILYARFLTTFESLLTDA